MSKTPARLIRAAQVARLRDIDRLHEDARMMLQRANEEAERQREALLQEARERALRDSAQSAARLIAQAEALAERQMNSLEPTLARLVSETVREVIGEMDREETVVLATRQALARLRDHRRARILAAPDIADAVKSAIALLDGEGAEVIEVQVDERLKEGRTILSSDRGHVEIGLDDQISRATESFGQQSDELPEDAA